MHIETVGYIPVKRSNRDDIENWMDKHGLFEMDSHEDEIITDVDPKAIKDAKGKFISKEQAQLLLEKCDVIKFYW